MKKYKSPDIFINLQRKLDARFGKGLCKAAVILTLFCCLSLSSCIDDKKAELSEIPATEAPVPKQAAPPVKITITDTKQTAVPGDLKELYKDHLIVKDAYFAKKNEEVHEGKSTKVTYEKISAAALNETVYVVVDTFNLGNQKITLKILDKDGIIAKSKYGAIEFVKSNGGEFKSKVDYYEGEDQRFAVFEISLKGVDDKATNEWIDKIGKSKDKKIKICLQVDVPDKKDVIYCGTNPADRKEGTDEKNVWLDQEGKWFEVIALGCYCNRDFTVAEIAEIITQLRKKDDVHEETQFDTRGNKLFVDKDGKVIPSDDRGRMPKEGVGVYKKTVNAFDKEGVKLFFLDKVEKIQSNDANIITFTKELNAAFKKYDISTCIRKIHFLAQSYHESQRFGLTYESNPRSTVSGGEHYRGRGLLQLTHDYNYKKFYIDLYEGSPSDKQLYDFAPKVAQELHLAVYASSFFWKNIGAKTGNISQYADIDDVLAVSKEINGYVTTPVGYDSRVSYTTLLKEIFKYNECKNKK